jgi:hypothetical protein
MNHAGARHLYLLDYDESNLQELKKSIQTAYPDVKVRSIVFNQFIWVIRLPEQVTVTQGDAASDAKIKGLCDQAFQEEGRLDVFFANVSCHWNPWTLVTCSSPGWHQ